jgi:hypothetical protein
MNYFSFLEYNLCTTVTSESPIDIITKVSTVSIIIIIITIMIITVSTYDVHMAATCDGV